MADNFEKFSDPDRQQITTADVEDTTEKKVKISPVAICRIAGMLLAGLISAYLVSAVHRSEVVVKQEDKLQQLARQRAELSARNVEIYVHSVQKTVAQFAGKPLLSTGLIVNDTETLERYSKMLSEQLEDVVSVRFFARGSAKHDAEIYPPIRFSELELIRFAENRMPLQPEAVVLGKDRLLSFVSPVPATGEQPAIGSMLVSLKVDGLTKVLEQNNIGMGDITLLQMFNTGKPQIITRYAGDSVAAAQQVAVADTPWEVRFSPGYRMSEQARVNIPFLLTGLGVFSIVLIGAALWLGSRLGERIQVVLAQGKAKGAWETISAVAAGTETVEDVSGNLYRKTDILDVDIAEEDQELLGLEDEEKGTDSAALLASEQQSADQESGLDIPDHIFRAYDIRGDYGTDIDEGFAEALGRALGSEALDLGENTLIVARDARLHSPKLTEYLIRGILSSGCQVLNIGTVPTPLLYFATETLDASSSGVMVTASHNPGHQNGFKVVMKGKCRSEHDIKAIRSRMMANNVYQGKGEEMRLDIVPNYIDTIFSDVALAGDVSIVIDAANAVAGMVAPRLFEELGCQVTPLFCELDGNFPNHDPDPTIESNLSALIAKVKEVKADLGVALDGDGDRIVVVTGSGKIIWPDRLLMLFARDIVSRNPGADVVFDVKSTRHLNNCITEVGGRPIMWKTGHSPMKAKMVETGALVGGEYSGHIFIKDRWFGFDDGLYAAARLIEILSLQGETLDEIFAAFPESPSSPEIRVDVAEDKKFDIIKSIIEKGQFGNGKITTLDGMRVDYSNGWGLIRASNTSAHLTLRFEADDENALHQLKSLFVKELRAIDNTINVDWNKNS